MVIVNNIYYNVFLSIVMLYCLLYSHNLKYNKNNNVDCFDIDGIKTPCVNFEGFTQSQVLTSLVYGIYLPYDSFAIDDINKYLTAAAYNYNYIDYVKGKAIKTDFSTFPKLESALYNKYNGKGKMEQILKHMKIEN